MSIVKKALESARHELTTLHGLVAADGTSPSATFNIDVSGLIDLLDQALSEVSQPCDKSTQLS